MNKEKVFSGNNYTLSDLHEGLEESFTRTITADMMDKFLDITGDNNPLHNEEDFAKEKGYNGRVVYGMLTASMISTLGGVYLPGRNCLIQGVEVKFSRPVFIGDVITIKGVVKEIHESVGQVIINVTIRNQEGTLVSKGKLKAGVLQ